MAATTHPLISIAALGLWSALLVPACAQSGPAAADDTKPFPASEQTLAAAKAVIGKDCAKMRPGGSFVPGFRRAAGFMPITLKDGYIDPVAIGAARVAFLVKVPNGDFGVCVVQDFAVLPPQVKGNQFLQCDDTGDDSTGFGAAGKGEATAAWWQADVGGGHIKRATVTASVRCQQPESGD